MKSRLTPEAERDIGQALAWYDGKNECLGDDFLRHIAACIESIERKPLMYRKIHRQLRRALVQTFPYQIIYEVEPDEIVVYAAHHSARNPNIWKRRVKR